MERRGRSRAATRRRARRASPPRAPKQGSPQSQRIAGFSLFFNALPAFGFCKILKSISIFCKQVCLLFACDEKSLGFLRAALFISPMIFSMFILATKPGYCFSIRQTSPELRDDLSRGILPFPFLRLCRRRNR